MKQVQDDEIDLFELFQTFWDGKWLISACVAIAVLLGGGFILRNDPVDVYESKLIYSVETIPPFYPEKNVLTDFQKKFFSIKVFQDWKKSNNTKSFLFEDFSANKVVDGFEVSKADGDPLATLVTDRKGGNFVLVKSDNLLILDDFFKYANHINELLKKESIVRTNAEIKFIESKFRDLGLRGFVVLKNILLMHRYNVSLAKGAKVLAIQRPTLPKKKSTISIMSPFSILLISVFLGGMVGIFFILVRNAIKKRKEQLTKA